MKSIITIPLALLWLSLSGGYLYLISKGNVEQVNTFKADNIAIVFNYPSNWKVDVQGDMALLQADKFITLTDNEETFSIMIRQNFESDAPSKCKEYNDCEFIETPIHFLFVKNDFEEINRPLSVYMSKSGGVDFIFDTQGSINLFKSGMRVGNSYELYQTIPNGKFSTIIKLDNKVSVHIAYQADKLSGIDRLDELKSVLKQILNSLASNATTVNI